MRKTGRTAALLAITLTLVVSLNGSAAAGTLAATPDPATDPLPRNVVLAGSGYAAGGGPVLITGAPKAGPAMNILLGLCAVDSLGNLTGTISGTACTFSVGASAADISLLGGYELTATQGANVGKTNFGVVTSNGVPPPDPQMSLAPNPFTAADTITFSGCGYQVLGNANTLDLYLSDGPMSAGKYALATGIAVDPAVSASCPSGGSWSVSLKMPANIPTGTYYVNTYRAGNAAAVSSLVQASANYTLNWTQPSAGPATAVTASPNFTG